MGDESWSYRFLFTVIGLWLMLVAVSSLLFKWYLATHVVKVMGGD